MSAATDVEGIDLDDTTSCPTGPACEGCAQRDGLVIATARVFGGVVCLTLCSGCIARPLPTFTPLVALSRVCRHAEHLGIDVDLMAAVLDAEDGR